jgi:hypothetical protein
MTTVAAYAVPAAKAPFERHAVRESDALIDVKFAGVVSEVGPGVTQFAFRSG